MERVSFKKNFIFVPVCIVPIWDGKDYTAEFSSSKTEVCIVPIWDENQQEEGQGKSAV